MNNKVAVWTTVRASGKSPMDQLFSRMAGMYHAMWQKHFDTPEKVENWKLVWAEAFAEERITPDEVAKALKGLLRSNRAFAPTLPEFLVLCRPPIDYDRAFYEAVAQMGIRRRPAVRLVNGEIVQQFDQDQWSHPAIYWAARAMGSDLDQQYNFIKARWAYELDRVLSEEIKPVPQNNNLLPNHQKQYTKELTPEEQKNVDAMFAQLRSMFDEGKPNE